MSEPYPSVDRDYAEQNYQTAQRVLSEVGVGLAGASPEVSALYQQAHNAIAKGRNAIYRAQHEIDRVLNDNDIYPKGRYEKASAAYEKAADVAKQELARAEGVARVMGPMLESAAMPGFVGSDQEQQFLRDEIRDIVNRSGDPAEALVQLATDPRYAGLAASPFGRSLLLGRGMDQRRVESAAQQVRDVAFAWAMEHGTPEQRQAAGRVSVAETMQAAPMAAGSAFQMWLEEMAAKVKAAGVAAGRAG
jgi:hypothetical protein